MVDLKQRPARRAGRADSAWKLVALAVLGFLVPAGAPVQAQPAKGTQDYPNRQIRMIVPFPAAGGYDFMARNIGQKLTEAWGQPVVIDNRVGANGNIGAEIAAKATVDGGAGSARFSAWMRPGAGCSAPSFCPRS